MAARDGAGRFVAGASGNSAGRPPLVRDPAKLGAEAQRRAGRLLEWVLWSAVISGASSLAAGSGALLAAAEALDEAAMTLRDLSRIGGGRVVVDSGPGPAVLAGRVEG